MFFLAFIFVIKFATDLDKPIKICTGNFINVRQVCAHAVGPCGKGLAKRFVL